MKGQTAMEYLMTYGWAIVVIVIVLAALAAFFSQSQTFEYCSFSPVNSFTCQGNPAIYKSGDNVMVSLTFRNDYQDEVTLSSITCEGQAADNSVNGDKISSGATYTKEINCGNVGDVGSKFNKKIEVKYQLPSDVSAGSYRTATATVSGQVASQ